MIRLGAVIADAIVLEYGRDAQARRLERLAAGPAAEALFAGERLRSHKYGGWSGFDDEPPADATSGVLAEIRRNRSGVERGGR